MSKEKKPLSRGELQEEYNKTAALMGHQSRLLYQAQMQIDELEKQVKALLDHLVELNEEGKKLPPEEVEKSEAPPPSPNPPVEGVIL